MTVSAGKRFRIAMEEESPLQIVGTINAFSALMAKQVGHKAIYLSGAGVANASFGLPDLGMTTLENVVEDASRITDGCDVPLLVDIDTGWGGAVEIGRCVKSLEKAGVAAVHIEDQVEQKRCGHRPNKKIVSPGEMVNRIKSAVDEKIDSDFVVMARTDALAVEGMKSMIERIKAYEEAGADAIFAEAMTEIDMYRQVTDVVDVPVLANLTEFGMTPMYTTDELAGVGIRMVLYPLSAFRAMSQAALTVYRTLRIDGTQEAVIPLMQTREELYEILGYQEIEEKLDQLSGNNGSASDNRE